MVDPGFREKQPWCEFAEPADETGASTKFLSGLAIKYGMVIVSPILEREEKRGGILWNTSVVISHTGNVIGKIHSRVNKHVVVANCCNNADISNMQILQSRIFFRNYEEKPHSQGGGLQRVHLLHGGEHRAQSIRNKVW